MMIRQQRRAAERKVTKNGVETRMLTETQVEQLRQLMQPLVGQWRLSRAVVTGFLVGSGIPDTNFSIGLNTGIVTLIGSQSPAPSSNPNGTEATQPPEVE